MNTMRTLIGFTTTATLAVCLQVSTIGIANAATLASNSTSNSTKDRSRGEGPTPSTSTVLTVAQTSRVPNNPKKYEPDPNGNPKSDGTGTR
ncbi:hypothetical protein QUB60_26275 [Microcoleus sp. A2-C5]|uniref:hypothetical protein n=1 Tax=Microcoleaceae TaxID=1892252 RepID=UPI002237119B|nr:hypothetical protein [Lyngbya sp. CCAP 1446/10]MCW6053133.1 hypothetical protein [Lyngbya sp. CCAP 1446/10]